MAESGGDLAVLQVVLLEAVSEGVGADSQTAGGFGLVAAAARWGGGYCHCVIIIRIIAICILRRRVSLALGAINGGRRDFFQGFLKRIISQNTVQIL